MNRSAPPCDFSPVLFLSIVVLLVFIACKKGHPFDASDDDLKTVIAFGSCNHQWDPQSIWESVQANDPDLWIWLGDIIYADTDNMDAMRAMYDQQKNNPDYASFSQAVPIVGIWDDHDYGMNNAGKEYTKKDSSKINLLSFLDVPHYDEVWDHAGTYQSRIVQKGAFKVKILLLDVRYFRDPPDLPGGSVLGKQQWEWFVQELSESDAHVHLIGGGIQFLPEEHGYEKWSNFEGEKERLLQVLDSLNVRHPVLLSGDRHFGEIMVQETAGSRPVYEVTSSGLTHSYEELEHEPNRYRRGDFINQKNFGVIIINWNQNFLSIQLRTAANKIYTQETLTLE